MVSLVFISGANAWINRDRVVLVRHHYAGAEIVMTGRSVITDMHVDDVVRVLSNE